MKYVVYIIELNLGQEHYYGEPSSDIIEAKGSREFFDNYKEAFDFFVSYSYGKCGDRFALPPVAVPNEFENERICKNCKWFNQKDNDCQNTENYQIFGDYDNIVDIPMQTTKYFGCIRFGRKDVG